MGDRPTYRSLCIAGGLKPSSALIKIIGGDARELALVHSLDLSKLYVGPKHVTAVMRLLAAGSLPAIEELDVTGNDVSPEAATFLASALLAQPCSAAPLLRRIGMRGCFLPLKEAQALLDAVRAAPHVLYVDLTAGETDASVVASIHLAAELNRQRAREAAQTLPAASGTGGSVAAAVLAGGDGPLGVDAVARVDRPPTAPVTGSPARTRAVVVGAGDGDASAAAFGASRLIAEQQAVAIEADYEWLSNCGDEDAAAARLDELIAMDPALTADASVADESAIIASPPPRVDSLIPARAPPVAIREGAPSLSITDVTGAQVPSSTPGTELTSPVSATGGGRDGNELNSFPQMADSSAVVKALVSQGPAARGRAVVAPSSGTPEGEPEADADDDRFIDTEFPPCLHSAVPSIARKPTVKDAAKLRRIAAERSAVKIGGRWIHWRRLTDRADCVSPRLYSGGSISAVNAGCIAADQWLVSALRVIRGVKDVRAALKALCVKEYAELGLFVVSLRKADTVVEVTVDDFVPCDADTGELLGTHNEDPNELWAAIIEKAYAKLHGGYDRLSRGSLGTGLSDLLGGCVTKQRWELAAVRSMVASGSLARKIHGLVHDQSGGDTVILGQPKARGELERSALSASGLSPNDAYILDNSRHIDDRTFVIRLRLPVPGKRWNGRYGPDSRELQDPAIRTALQWRDEQAANFTWMTVEDYAAFVGNLYTLQWHATGEDVPRAVVADHPYTWMHAEHRGPFDLDPLWTEAPTVGARVSRKNTTVSVHVMLPDQRLLGADAPLDYSVAMQVLVLGREARPSKRAGDDAGKRADELSLESMLMGSHIGAGPVQGSLDVASVDATRVIRDWNPESEVIFKSPLVHAREVAVDVVMQPNVSYYVVVGIANVKSSKLLIKLRSTGRFSSTGVESLDSTRVLPCEWAEHTAGGPAFTSTLVGRSKPILVQPSPRALTNPQFLVRVKAEARVTIMIAQCDPRGEAAMRAVTSPNRAVAMSGVSSPSFAGSTHSNAAVVANGDVAAPDASSLFAIGMIVATGYAAFSDMDALKKATIVTTDFATQRSISLQLHLPQGSYVVVPCTHLPGQCGPFALHLFSSERVEVKKVSM